MRIVVIAAALVCFAACQKQTPPPAPGPSATDTAVAAAKAAPDPHVLDDDRRCTSDADCTLTTVDCCGCNALGAQTGVRKDHVAALTARRTPVCAAVQCAQQMSDDPSCSAREAACRSGVCVPDTGEAAPETKGPAAEPIH